MQDYVFGVRCRQQSIVRYFTDDDGERCGICDGCTDADEVRSAVAASREQHRKRADGRARKAKDAAAFQLTEEQLAQIIEFVDQLRKPLGKRLVAPGLRGSQAKNVKRKGLLKHPLHGALKDVPEAALLDALEDLLEAGRLVRKGRKYPTVWLPDKRVRAVRSPGERPKRPPATGLRGDLERFRKAAARKRRWKPYQVFDNATLLRIVQAQPRTPEDLLAIKGLGPKRVQHFGESVLQMVREAAWRPSD